MNHPLLRKLASLALYLSLFSLFLWTQKAEGQTLLWSYNTTDDFIGFNDGTNANRILGDGTGGVAFTSFNSTSGTSSVTWLDRNGKLLYSLTGIADFAAIQRVTPGALYFSHGFDDDGDPVSYRATIQNGIPVVAQLAAGILPPSGQITFGGMDDRFGYFATVNASGAATIYRYSDN